MCDDDVSGNVGEARIAAHPCRLAVQGQLLTVEPARECPINTRNRPVSNLPRATSLGGFLLAACEIDLLGSLGKAEFSIEDGRNGDQDEAARSCGKR